MSKSLDQMTDSVRIFCEERDWDPFHTPKELAIGLVTEASELLDIFRFQTESQIEGMFKKESSKQAIEDEVADVLFFLLRFAQKNQISLPKALEAKIKKNQQKYPIEKSKSNNQKYTQLT